MGCCLCGVAASCLEEGLAEVDFGWAACLAVVLEGACPGAPRSPWDGLAYPEGCQEPLGDAAHKRFGTAVNQDVSLSCASRC